MAAVTQLKTHIINYLQEFESMEQFKAELIEYLESMCKNLYLQAETAIWRRFSRRDYQKNRHRRQPYAAFFARAASKISRHLTIPSCEYRF